MDFDRSKTLEELENHYWGEPTMQSYLVTTCHALRRKPLNEFTIPDLAIMTREQIGLPYLVPLAIDALEDVSLLSRSIALCDLFSDLVTHCGDEFWRANPTLWERTDQIVSELEGLGDPLLSPFQTVVGLRVITRRWRGQYPA